MSTKTKNIKAFYPLTPMQQGMLFHSIAAPASGVYFGQFSWLIQGKLNVNAFHRAWQHSLERHEILRTGFVWGDVKEPVQILHEQVALPWQQQDWRHLSPIEQQPKLEAFLRDDRHQGFDLKHPPLMRLALIHLSEDLYHFTWSHHHLLLDGWSCATLMQEVVECYIAFSHDRDISLEPVRPYRDYIVWLQQQDQSEAEAFWRQRLQGLIAPTRLAVDQGWQVPALPAEQHQQETQLSATITAALGLMAQQQRLTLNVLVQAAWALLLSRYSSQEDVVFGVTTSGRPPALANIESMVGLLINTLPVRVQVSPDASLSSWLQQLQTQQLETHQYEHSSLMHIQGWSQVPRGLPLFESIVIFENYPVDASLQKLDLNLEFKNFSTSEQTNYPLNLVIHPGKELSLKIAYDRNRFGDDTITRMLGHLQTLLTGMVANPNSRLCELPLLTAAEQQQILVDWNNTQIDYPQDQCFHQLFAAQVARTPDAIAAVFKDEQLTYDQLNRRANQVAHFLQKRGVKPEVIVGLCVERSLNMVIGWLGILKAGGAYLPLDPTYPVDRLEFMLSDSQVPLLVTTQKLVTALPNHSTQVVCLDADWDYIAQESEQNCDSGANVENLAYLIYTSGSTGVPKGVLVNHEGLSNLTQDKIRTCKVQPESRVLQFFSLSFDASIPELVMSLGCGAALHLATPEDLLPGANLVRLLRQQAITHITLPPSALAVLPAEDLPALQMVLVGGEAPAAEMIIQWSKGRLFINAYGPTETTVNASMVECGNSEYGDRSSMQPTVRPAANKQLYILDRHLQPVPIGVPGELHIGGVGLARGYLNRPEKTAEAFIPNPFRKAEGRGQRAEGRGQGSRGAGEQGSIDHTPSTHLSIHPSIPLLPSASSLLPSQSHLYKTGDLACYLPNGHIKLLGRLDHQVKIRGFRIEPGEIEAVLVQHPAVQESVVIVREDQPGDKRLVAYVVTVPECTPTTSDLNRYVGKRLPKHMVPSAFVILDALPLNPNGKIDRQALPALDLMRPELAAAFVAPRTPTEAILAQVFAQVLEVEQVGIHDDFFELGGHSLLSTRLIARLLQRFQVELSIADLFESPTVANLAQQLEQAQIPKQQTPKQQIPEHLNQSIALPEPSIHETTSAFLTAEAVLDPTIRPDTPLSHLTIGCDRIFLTGATGFLGAFLLSELLQQTQAEIYCLVRDQTLEMGQKKLKDCLESYLLWDERHCNRIIPVIGDLSQPLLGLSEAQFQTLADQIDVIYHNGAWVHHTSPYSLLKATNVLGTQEVLRLAYQTKVKPVHFMSATSVFASGDHSEKQVIREQDQIDGQVPWGGYSQSKWVAETLVTTARDRGLPVSIYRLGRISGHSQTGVFNQNDFLYRLIIGCVHLGSTPDTEEMLDIVPIDYASRAIVHLSQQETSWGKTFHLVHPHPVSSVILLETLRSMGYAIQQIPYDQWRVRLLHIAQASPDHALYPLVSLFPANSAAQPSDSAALKFDCQNTLDGLSQTSLTCPPINTQLLHTYFSHLIQHGFLTPPPS